MIDPIMSFEQISSAALVNGLEMQRRCILSSEGLRADQTGKGLFFGIWQVLLDQGEAAFVML